jgi:hypothetical protein
VIEENINQNILLGDALLAVRGATLAAFVKINSNIVYY